MRFITLVPVIVLAIVAASVESRLLDNDILDVDLAQAYVHRPESKLKVESTGDCSDRNNRHCTSLDGIRRGTMLAMLKLSERTCPEIKRLVIIGGTEVGYSTGVNGYSHKNGYQVKLIASKQLDNCLKDSAKFKRTIDSNGHTTYMSNSDGDTYVYVKRPGNYIATYKAWCLDGSEVCNPEIS